eukprot:m.60814 g.60814  ORF g.60814 m.60814 type:complete len:156 (-) comp11366_c0_seq30:1534-2001(-)
MSKMETTECFFRLMTLKKLMVSRKTMMCSPATNFLKNRLHTTIVTKMGTRIFLHMRKRGNMSTRMMTTSMCSTCWDRKSSLPNNFLSLSLSYQSHILFSPLTGVLTSFQALRQGWTLITLLTDNKSFKNETTTDSNARAHTHTHVHIYIYVYTKN